MRRLNSQMRTYGPIKGIGNHVEEWCELWVGGVLKYTTKLDEVYVKAKGGNYNFGECVKDIVQVYELAADAFLDSLDLCDTGFDVNRSNTPVLVFVPQQGASTSNPQLVDVYPKKIGKSLVDVDQDSKDFSDHLQVEITSAGLKVCIVRVNKLAKGVKGHFIGVIWDASQVGAETPIVGVHVYIDAYAKP